MDVLMAPLASVGLETLNILCVWWGVTLNNRRSKDSHEGYDSGSLAAPGSLDHHMICRRVG